METTAQALFTIPLVPARARILDLACGPGAQTLDLARLLPDARITAVDPQPPFLDDLQRRAAAAGFTDRITAVSGDPADPPDGPWDVVWSERALGGLDLPDALTTFEQVLAPAGAIALTEPVWLTDDPPERLQRVLGLAYPHMARLETRRVQLARAGWVLHGELLRPERDWRAYHEPMQARIAALRPTPDPALHAVLADAEAEITLRREEGRHFGYAFFVVGREDSRAEAFVPEA